MSDYTQKTGMCSGCNARTTALLHRQFIGSGAEAFLWKCGVCGKPNPFGGSGVFIKKDLVRRHLTECHDEWHRIVTPQLVNPTQKP